MTDARRVLDACGASSCDVDGLRYWWIEADLPTPANGESGVHLLPIYDEYTVAYRDRAAVPHADPRPRPRSTPAIVHPHAVVIEGQIAGTWRPTEGRHATTVDVQCRRRFSAAERQALAEATARYARFMGTPMKAHLH